MVISWRNQLQKSSPKKMGNAQFFQNCSKRLVTFALASCKVEGSFLYRFVFLALKLSSCTLGIFDFLCAKAEQTDKGSCDKTLPSLAWVFSLPFLSLSVLPHSQRGNFPEKPWRSSSLCLLVWAPLLLPPKKAPI